MTARLSHALRSDARDNRDRILDAARAVFATDGLNVPMREIARRAEVGPATVYRHFPTKEMLVTEAFTDQMLACKSIVDEGLADPDPWRGFCLAVEKLCELQARDHGFTAAFKSTFPHAMDFAAIRTSSLSAAAELIRRTKDTGRLRPDIVLDDLILMIMANGGIHASTPAARSAASRRFAALTIQGFQASPVSSPLPPVPHLTPAVSVPRHKPTGEPRGDRGSNAL
ncbi:TetR/AcrR family transcriptional regulator [Kibdelosporangium aridum]|uniref:TetR/AcrR family transcriptional regulator n=1 Tax=Kibdelosporangium aridum TaxID=2030 RepID=A0A428Y333_KIBAR|nr:TetR/AcrR family transcriptional regulator [Kibdelosporangium aridum]RSM61997.1 TetR/AcrR family transcriptional regulator [Kibdelosporangium aridum]